MERLRITCPDSAHLEAIDVERTPFGLVLHGCSRFEPHCAVECDADCVRRLDMRARANMYDRRDRVLLVFGRGVAATAHAIAEKLRADQFHVELTDGDLHTAPPPADYDVVVIGSAVHFGHPDHTITAYVRAHRAELAQMPALFFSVSHSGLPEVGAIRRATGWLPSRSVGFQRPSWRTRWFGDPGAQRAARVHELGRMVADEMLPG
jgi:hypothetical protein